ncbi:aspartate/glutamate racemase family protein [Alicyclobacillus fastidiosus]|uniref:Aspartate/glutamate racemase family protein n=1 Tax=Alicyclobacillus fastidiosus TaxID=392011 RepID=A0ABV5ABK9_9BACL|nr:aspartate/glutamate racemase family protein [Alicyclobacillus fastidiosus]WEH10448.1 aspartate/glutamate racemase family protein [Alicyclobacillus fastidiosus]
MKIKLINPNTTWSMTKSIEEAAKKYASDDVTVFAVSPQMGPTSIESYYDDYLAIPGTLDEIRKGDEEEGCDGYVIACFGDPGLHAARELTDKPVVGIAEAATFMASMLARRFSVVTVLDRSRCLIEDVVNSYVPGGKIASVRTTGWAVLAFEQNPEEGLAALAQESRRAVAEDGAEAILLGCAGFADFAQDLERQLGVPVLDGVAAATKFVELLVRMNKTTSKVLTYARPEQKSMTGILSSFSVETTKV